MTFTSKTYMTLIYTYRLLDRDREKVEEGCYDDYNIAYFQACQLKP